jgi:DnaK suppressor protein
MNKEYATIKDQLLGKLKELEERSERLENSLSQPGEADSEENAILHEDDQVLEGLSNLATHDIHEIRMAIDRIDRGTYGVCTQCHRAIAKARLNALPFTSTCVDCAR